MTIEDHIIAHLILTRVYPTHAGILWGALVMLKCSNNGIISCLIDGCVWLDALKLNICFHSLMFDKYWP